MIISIQQTCSLTVGTLAACMLAKLLSWRKNSTDKSAMSSAIVPSPQHRMVAPNFFPYGLVAVTRRQACYHTMVHLVQREWTVFSRIRTDKTNRSIDHTITTPMPSHPTYLDDTLNMYVHHLSRSTNAISAENRYPRVPTCMI